MSERASASLPSICSGDMYWMVPTTLPATVSGLTGVGPDMVRAADRSGADPEPAAPSVAGLAKPKSISLVPALVSMMLPGLRSRCTMPARCAISKASATSIPIFRSSGNGKGPFRRRSARVSPSRNSMTRKSVPSCEPTS